MFLGLLFAISIFLQAIKPTVLIGSSGVGKTFTKEVVEAIASFNEVLFLRLCLIYFPLLFLYIEQSVCKSMLLIFVNE